MIKSLIALSLLAASAAAPASAQQAGASVHVRYADLDLSTDAGRQTLDRRLAAALDTVCPTARPGFVTPSPQGLRCRASAEKQITVAREQALAQHGSAVVRISAVR
ncbi:UrcA family protein [Sphingomonas sp. KR3-1]|uniref:UrcA family protein n=1 Tax=Sphingomonas sp. KR3-1 TaxID=3156611 RepID=UPI0032B4425A